MVVGGSMCGCGGHAWLWWDMHGLGRGHVWLWEACMVVGGHMWLWGTCMVAGEGGVHGCGGTCMGCDKIQSMSGQYTFYWNAFLFGPSF